MPVERYSTSSSSNGRPLMPSLATNRTPKTPLTPRLAANTAQTPLSRRADRGDGSTTPRENNSQREDFTTPIKSLLNSNVTPRSSARKSRAGSTQSTPNGTPTGTPVPSRPVSTIDYGGPKGIGGASSVHGSHIGGSDIGGSRPRVGYMSGQSRPQLSSRQSTPHAGTDDHASKFFHASEVQPQAKPIEQPPPTRKQPTFFYANGVEDVSPTKSGGMPSPPLSQVGAPSRPQGKFFLADSLSDTRSNGPILTPPILAASPEPLGPPTLARPASLRCSSPAKDNAPEHPRKSLSGIGSQHRGRGTPPLSTPSGPNPPLSQPYPSLGGRIQQTLQQERRRSSADTTFTRKGHSKSASLSSIESFSPSHKQFQPTLETPAAAPTSPLANDSLLSIGTPEYDPPGTPGSPLSIAAVMSEEPASESVPQSPSRSSTNINALNELAANARRERKVLDLEISNSSLLAINRQLEREVRKQKAELRRFRRLSRAGRLSINTGVDVIPTVLEGEDESSLIGSDIGDQSEINITGNVEDMEIGENTPEEELSESEEDLSSTSITPSEFESADSSRLARDSKRLELDLSKHHQLLLDSTKMNQSLKRCLGWTEELIKEGRKALEYQVRVSDVKLGGRILCDDHLIEDDEVDINEDIGLPSAGGALLSPWSPPAGGTAFDFPFISEELSYEEASELENALFPRDSEIEIPLQHESEEEEDNSL